MPRVVVVLPFATPWEGALYREASRIRPGVHLVIPATADVLQWPTDMHLSPLRTMGRRHTRKWFLGLTDVVRSFDPDLIHVHHEPWAVTTQRMISTGRPVVIHAVENIYRDAPPILRARRVGMSRALRECAGYLNWGETGLAAARAAGLPATTPSRVLSGGTPDPDLFRCAPLREPDGTFRVVFVGRLVPEKGADTLVRAAAAEHRRAKVHVTIVGDGPEARKLRSLAARLGSPVDFTGRLDARATHAAVEGADAVVVPSRDIPKWSEQWGRVVIEAMMTGRPVLVSDGGELPFLVGNPDWVFRQGDPQSLGHALDELIEDPALVASRVAEGKERAAMFGPAVLAAQLVDFWDLVLERWTMSPR